MTIKDEIITIANKLANQGRKPSVALVKNKLSQPTPLPMIISTLKGWVHEPSNTELNSIKVKTSSLNNKEPNLKQLIADELQPIKDELAEVKGLLEQVLSQLNK